MKYFMFVVLLVLVTGCINTRHGNPMRRGPSVAAIESATPADLKTWY